MEEIKIKTKNPYWSLYKLKMLDDKTEHFIKKYLNNGNKTIIDLHKHSCVNRKYPLFEVGKEYYIDIAESIFDCNYKKCKITGIRSGIIFYIPENSSKENSFQEFSIKHYFSEPVEISVNLDSNFYIIKSRSGKMKINYMN